MNEVTAPLRDIIRRAASREITGPAAKLQARMKSATDTTVLMCDVSSSMMDLVAGLRKIDHLRVAVRDLHDWHPNMVIICFSTGSRRVAWDRIPEPCGGTDLAGALRKVGKLRPKRTIIVSDGEPNDGPGALAAAADMTGIIDVVYCGSEHACGAEFMRSLARSTGGDSVSWDEEKPRLASNVRGLLMAPGA